MILANPSDIPGRFTRQRLILLLACWCIGFFSTSAAAQTDQPTAAEQRWLDRYFEFIRTGEIGDDLLNEQRLITESLKTYPLNGPQLKRFTSLPIGRRALGGFWEALSEDAWITFLRMRDLEDGRTALFRLSDGEGLNYIEMYIEPRPDGEVWAWDMHPYVSGERFTESLRRMLIPAIAQVDENVRKHMGKRNRELSANMGNLRAMYTAQISEDFEQVINLYESLPESVQQERICLIYATQSYFALGREDKYQALLKQFLKLHGEASNRELMLMDIYNAQEKYQKSLEMVDDLDQRVGGDIYLESYRGSIHYQSGDYQKCKTAYDRGIQGDPALLDFYWESISFAIAEKDWPRVSKMLDGVQAQGVELNPLREVPEYKDYVASDEYERWLSRQSQSVQDEQLGVDAEG